MKVSRINTNTNTSNFNTSFKSINIVGEGFRSLPSIKLSNAAPLEKDFLITYSKFSESKDRFLGISSNAEKATNYLQKLGERILNPITIQHLRHILRRALDEAISPANKNNSFCELLGAKEVSNIRTLIEKGTPVFDSKQKALILDFDPEEKVSVVLTRAQLAALKLPQS